MRGRQLLAFKRGPTVDIRLDDLIVKVRDDRVVLAIGDGSEYFSWEEWRDFARRVEHATHWIEEHTPEDANGPSYTVDTDG